MIFGLSVVSSLFPHKSSYQSYSRRYLCQHLFQPASNYFWRLCNLRNISVYGTIFILSHWIK